MNCKMNNGVALRLVTIDNKGNDTITISHDNDILQPTHRVFFAGDVLNLTYGVKIKRLSLWQRVKFLFGFIEITMEHDL